MTDSDPATIVVLAHLGHWYISLPIYLGPPIVLVAALKIAEWRDKRRRAAGTHGAKRTPTGGAS